MHRTCIWLMVPSRMTKTSLKSGCKFGDECNFRHTEVGGQISKKAMKSDGKRIGGFKEREHSIAMCVPRQLSEKVYSAGKWIESHSQALEDQNASRKRSRNDRVLRRESCISANLRSEFRELDNSRKDRKTKPYNWSGGPAWGMVKESKDAFYKCWSLGNACTYFEKARRAIIVNRSRSV